MKRIISSTAIMVCLALTAQVTEAQFTVGVGVSIRTAPPVLPVYTQPACPVDGYLWTPGYWAYGDDGYYWVPGVWMAPPTIGYLWTPGYWGYANGLYGWNAGYWGTTVGFYGGVNYGCGYGGIGFGGGIWAGGHFRYNTAVLNVNRTVIHNTYVDRTVIHNSGSRVSFNGPGGITRGPNAQEQVAMHQTHAAPTAAQFSHSHTASLNKGQYASVNHGRPSTTAMNKVGGSHFSAAGHSVAAASRHSTVTTRHSVTTHQPTTAHFTANANHATVNHSQTVSHKSVVAHNYNNHAVTPQTTVAHRSTVASHTNAPMSHPAAPMAHPAGGHPAAGGGHERHR